MTNTGTTAASAAAAAAIASSKPPWSPTRRSAEPVNHTSCAPRRPCPAAAAAAAAASGAMRMLVGRGRGDGAIVENESAPGTSNNCAIIIIIGHG